jgi:hypothetical protein
MNNYYGLLTALVGRAQLAQRTVLLILSALLLCLGASQATLAQCTNTNMITSNGASVLSSGINGICLGCDVSGEANLVNASTTDFATIGLTIGVASSGFIRLQLPQTYPAGTRVGWLVDLNGGLTGLLNGVTLRALLNGVVVGTVSSGSLINILGIGGGSNVNGVFCSPFNQVEIQMGSLAGVFATYRVFNAYVNGCSFPVQCGATPSAEICGDGIDNDGDGLVDAEDACTVACTAGTSAPALSATTKANVCPATTVDLSTITASNTPVGSTLTWHSGTPATTANKLSSITSLAAGTYYAAFFDAAANCYSNSGAGTTAVIATVATCAPISIVNSCPATTVNLVSRQTTTAPAGTSVTWHTGTPATTANIVADPTAVSTSGTYYASYYDAVNACFSPTSQGIQVTIGSCLTAINPAPKAASTGGTLTGNAATELTPTGGIGALTYSNGTSDSGCTPVVGATALPTANLTVTNASTGAYTVVVPSTLGTYYYCIKVCDSTSPTPACVVKTYTLTVTASCIAGSAAPLLIKN